MKPKALIVGGHGALATALFQGASTHFQTASFGRSQLDITDENAVRALLESEKPALVINGAAFNAVDRAQGEGARDALQINALGVSFLAQSCERVGARLVHFSTDFVFDGHKTSPYLETDVAHPLSIYGASKLCGENICLSVSPRNLAIRVCRLFGPSPESGANGARKPGGNFPLLMLRLARERGQVRVVSDQIGAPTYTPDLARAVWELIALEAGGLFHLSNAGEVSFADYAREIFEIAGVECQIERVSSEDYGAPARRPLYSTLSNQKAHTIGVGRLRHYSEALREFLKAA